MANTIIPTCDLENDGAPKLATVETRELRTRALIEKLERSPFGF